MFKAANTGLAAAAIIASTLLAPLAMAQPSALAEAGKRHFIRCSSCHALSAAAEPLAGPHLEGIVGRPAGAVAGFAYSAALRDQPFVWTEEQLDRWLEKPQELVPDMCMPFMGLPNPEVRKALIEYLKNPLP